MAGSALPVFATAAEVWRFVLHAQGAMVRIAAPWLLGGFALAALPPRLGWEGAQIWAVAGQLVDMLGYAVVGSRFVCRLVNGEPWPHRPVGPDGPALRYLLAHLLLALAGLAAGLAAGVVVIVPAALSASPRLGILAVAAAGLAALWITARLAPLPVLATTGRGFDLRGAFRLTRREAVRIVLVQLATLVPLAALVLAGTGLLAGIVGDGEALRSTPVALLVELVLRSVGYAEAALIGTVLAAITVHLELAAQARG